MGTPAIREPGIRLRRRAGIRWQRPGAGYTVQSRCDARARRVIVEDVTKSPIFAGSPLHSIIEYGPTRAQGVSLAADQRLSPGLLDLHNLHLPLLV